MTLAQYNTLARLLAPSGPCALHGSARAAVAGLLAEREALAAEVEQLRAAAGRLNLNDVVRVKVNPRGVRAWRAHFESIGMGPPPMRPDADGYLALPLWEVANIFGPYLFMGPEPPIETTILIGEATR